MFKHQDHSLWNWSWERNLWTREGQQSERPQFAVLSESAKVKFTVTPPTNTFIFTICRTTLLNGRTSCSVALDTDQRSVLHLVLHFDQATVVKTTIKSVSEGSFLHVRFYFRFYIIWFVKKLLLSMYYIYIQSHYVVESKTYQITDFIHHKDYYYYLDIKSIFIFGI